MQSITDTIIEYPAINKAIFSAPPLVQGILLSLSAAAAAAAAVRVNIFIMQGIIEPPHLSALNYETQLYN